MPGRYSCEVVDIDKLTGDVFMFTVINSDMAAESEPGQFLHIKCGKANLLRRPLSICSVCGSSVAFVFEVKGEGTRWLSRRKPGHILDILGPLGKKFSIPDGKIITIGGGMGAPPMLFAAESAVGGVTAIIGFKSKDRILLKDEFAQVCDEVFVTTDDDSFGLRGPVTRPLVDLLENGGYSAVLACGPQAMLSAVAVLSKLYGVPCQVSLEERMGCGVGACLVCACATVSGGNETMSRVCKDGPVFDAAEVVWQT